ncbi:3-hydroxylacyl-ACP dehydratase [Achromobacter spanius]|uniref:3-hydroxylacyl-ACP dehydratase n=1 Tax=Achromobacter spanius TaxID=217203 RepID=A0A2S5GJY3_9BURK|nr:MULTISPECIES: hotdog family protein [Achromobacter]MDX3985841.1 hotdog family protein [Achromobacter sp.]PPA73390.1 3-hydroxylacyl-ACP dehydratase [Achromobacter spanius]QYJ23546.1 hotdog family protein [Achromobacter sp. ES-001]
MKACPWPVAALLPHAGNMILIDAVQGYDADSLTARTVIKPGPYSLPDGSLPPWLGMELMAQAVGAWAGCQAREADAPVKLGFLLGTRRYDCHADTLPAGAALTIHVQRGLIDASGMSVFECELRDESRLLAHARLNVYQPKDPDEFTQEASLT